MNLSFKEAVLILVLAVLWAMGGYAIGGSIIAMGLDYAPLKIIFAGINMVIGLSLFLGVTNDPTAERIFFKGPRPNEDGLPAIGCLWVLPISVFIFGTGMWLVTIVLRFIYK